MNVFSSKIHITTKWLNVKLFWSPSTNHLSLDLRNQKSSSRFCTVSIFSIIFCSSLSLDPSRFFDWITFRELFNSANSLELLEPFSLRHLRRPCLHFFNFPTTWKSLNLEQWEFHDSPIIALHSSIPFQLASNLKGILIFCDSDSWWAQLDNDPSRETIHEWPLHEGTNLTRLD